MKALAKALLTAVVIVLVVVDSIYQVSVGIHESDYALYLRTHPPALALFIALYALVGLFFYIIARWYS